MSLNCSFNIKTEDITNIIGKDTFKNLTQEECESTITQLMSSYGLTQEDLLDNKYKSDIIAAIKRGREEASKADIANITPNDKNLAAQTLQNDVKATLLALKEATANQPNQAALNQNINRLLTQIEMHQLISYAQNSLQTYLPYSWDALESSSVAFKQGKKKTS